MERLTHDAYHRLEYIVTMHFLEKYLPSSGLVLDAGGGPGRYSIELARKGYEVVLLDLSPKCLELAERKIARAHVRDKEKWARWKDLILKTCTDPILLGMGEHFLYVGRK